MQPEQRGLPLEQPELLQPWARALQQELLAMARVQRVPPLLERVLPEQLPLPSAQPEPQQQAARLAWAWAPQRDHGCPTPFCPLLSTREPLRAPRVRVQEPERLQRAQLLPEQLAQAPQQGLRVSPAWEPGQEQPPAQGAERGQPAWEPHQGRSGAWPE